MVFNHLLTGMVLQVRPAGMFGPRILPERPFGPPLPLTGCCLRRLLDLFFGFEALAADGVPPDGNK